MGTAVRVGVLGLRRGAALALARLAQQAGIQLVAVCERDDRLLAAAAGALDAAAYRDLEPSLEPPWTPSSWSTTSTSTPQSPSGPWTGA